MRSRRPTAPRTTPAAPRTLPRRSAIAAVVAAVAAVTVAGLISACGSGPSTWTPANTTPRATVQAFNIDLANRDFSSACRLVRPFARPLLTNVRTGHSLTACVAGLQAPGAPQLIAHYRLSAGQIRSGTVANLGAGLDSFTPTPIPDPVYLLNRVGRSWLIAGL